MGAENANTEVVDVPVDTPAEPAPEPTDTPVEPEPEIVTDEVTPDSFGWDEWDGTVDALPESVRGWGSKIHERLAKDVQTARDEAERARRVYESMMEGLEDPRIGELRKQLEAEGLSVREAKEAATKLQAEFQAYQEAMEAHLEATAKAEADAYKAQHSWIFDGGKVEQAACELIDQGWDKNSLPELLRMPPKMREAAQATFKQLKDDGAKNPDKYALQITKSTFKLETPKNDDLVAGADGPTPKAVHTRARPKNLTLHDAIDLASEEAFRRAR